MDPDIDKRAAASQLALEHPGRTCCFVTRWRPGDKAEAGEIRARLRVPDDVQRIAQAEDHGYCDVKIFSLGARYEAIDVVRANATGLLDGKRNAARNQLSC